MHIDMFVISTSKTFTPLQSCSSMQKKKGCSFNFALRNNLQKGLKGKFMKVFSI